METSVQGDLSSTFAPNLVMRHLEGVLSERELEVAQLAVSGLSTAEIARRLFVTLNTVKTHIRNILRKTGTANRSELTHRLVMAESSRMTPQARFLQSNPSAWVRDPLTGLLSQGAFGQMLTALQEAGGAEGLSVLFLEMDGQSNLPPVELIKVDLAVARLLATTLRSSDLVFRWGESQFVGLLPNVDRSGARDVCMRLAISLSQWAQRNGYDLLFYLSASSSHEGISSPDGLVEAAQKRLKLGLRNSA